MDQRYLDHRYEVAGRVIDPVVGHLRQDGEPSTLGRKQLEVLAMLASAAGEMVPREAFVERIWDGNALVGQRGLTDTIYALRRLLGDCPEKGPLIRTIPRRGYQLQAEVRLLENGQGLSFSASWAVPGRTDCRLVRLLSQNDVSETWLAEASDSGAQTVFRFCRHEAHLQKLRREIAVLRCLREKLAHRSDVLSILDWRLHEPPYYLEMPHAVHGSLAQWAEASVGLEHIPLAERVRLLAQAASALDAVHSADIVHRNISPASLLIDRDEHGTAAKLGEFGLGDADPSELAAMDISTTDLTLTSDGIERESLYLAPEREADRAADVYALGVVLYQLVVGDLRRPLSHRSLEAIAPTGLREAIADCVQARPEGRPTARALSLRLEKLELPGGKIEGATTKDGPAEPDGPAERDPSEKRDRSAERDQPAMPTQLLEPSQAAKPGGSASPDPSPSPGRSAKPVPSTGQRTPTVVGGSVGPFRLLDVLGKGGMGMVYLAEQREPVERKVALKLIRAGMDSDQVLARFEAERQALALMDHVNVAAVYDAGCSDSGHPYFAMEYVPGLHLTSHCDRSRLRLRERIELFIQVCAGVQHAHQKGLIHRDLKPSNILVKNPAGQPATVKIIDFGVAKSLQRRLSAQTVHTRVGTFVGTPRYSSPEQISDHLPDVDTRSDVYSLGIVLYELVTGVTPHSAEELAGKSSVELVKILDDDPPPPRSRYSHLEPVLKEEIARNRSRSVAELEQRLDTDLSWILLKCLERDPDDRYASVIELQKDLGRWLADEPIEARPATRLYRLRKLARRHRTAFAVTALTTLALLTTTSLAVVGFLRAEEQAARAQAAALEAEKAAEFQVRQLKSLDPSTMAVGIRQSLRRAVGVRMQERGEIPTDEAQRQLDWLLLGVNFTDLTLEQLENYFLEPALEEVQTSYQDFPLLQTRLWQAIAAILKKWGHFEHAVEPQELALDGRRALLGDDDPLTLGSLQSRGSLHYSLGRLDEAEADLRTAVSGLRRALGERDPATLEAIDFLGVVLLQKGDLDGAEEHFRKVLEERRRILGGEHAETLRSASNLGVVEWQKGHLDEAGSLFREALEGRRRILGEDHLDTLNSISQMGILLRQQEQLEEAELLYRQALDGARRRLGDEHPITLVYVNNLAELLGSVGQAKEAEALHRKNLELRRSLLGEDHPKTLSTLHNLAASLRSLERLEEAEVFYREALKARRRILGTEHPSTLTTISSLSSLLRERGALEEAEALAREALEGRRRLLGEQHQYTLTSLNRLGLVLRQRGQLEEAEALHRQALEAFRHQLGEEHPDTLRSIRYLADVLSAKGDVEQAELHYRQALAAQSRVLGEQAPATLRTKEALAALLRQEGTADRLR